MKQPPGDLHFPLKHNPGGGFPEVLGEGSQAWEISAGTAQNGGLNRALRSVCVNPSIPKIPAAPSSSLWVPPTLIPAPKCLGPGHWSVVPAWMAEGPCPGHLIECTYWE